MNLADVMPKLAAVFAPVADTDPNVYAELVDAIDPPAIMLIWAEPWLDVPRACSTFANPVVTCVAGRLEPGEGVHVLESMVAGVLHKLRADPAAPFAIGETSGPRILEVAGVKYLAARVPLRVSVAF